MSEPFIALCGILGRLKLQPPKMVTRRDESKAQRDSSPGGSRRGFGMTWSVGGAGIRATAPRVRSRKHIRDAEDANHGRRIREMFPATVPLLKSSHDPSASVGMTGWGGCNLPVTRR